MHAHTHTFTRVRVYTLMPRTLRIHTHRNAQCTRVHLPERSPMFSKFVLRGVTCTGKKFVQNLSQRRGWGEMERRGGGREGRGGRDRGSLPLPPPAELPCASLSCVEPPPQVRRCCSGLSHVGGSAGTRRGPARGRPPPAGPPRPWATGDRGTQRSPSYSKRPSSGPRPRAGRSCLLSDGATAPTCPKHRDARTIPELRQ